MEKHLHSSYVCVCVSECLLFHFSVALHIKNHESPACPRCQTTLEQLRLRTSKRTSKRTRTWSLIFSCGVFAMSRSSPPFFCNSDLLVAFPVLLDAFALCLFLLCCVAVWGHVSLCDRGSMANTAVANVSAPICSNFGHWEITVLL